MRVAFAADAFLLYVNHLARAGNVAVTAHDTPARQRREPQNTNDAHRTIPFVADIKQLPCRSPSGRLALGRTGSRGTVVSENVVLDTHRRWLDAHTDCSRHLASWIFLQQFELRE